MSAHGGESPTVSVSIRTAAGDEERAERLAEQLDGALVRISRTNTEADVGAEAGAWQPWTRRATHHLVLDAAVRPHPRLIAQVHEAIAGRPGAALRLFTPGDGYASHALRVAAFSGRPWLMPPGPDPSAVAVVLPLPEAAEFARSLQVGEVAPAGVLLHRFARERGFALLASTADLVQPDRPGRTLRAPPSFPPRSLPQTGGSARRSSRRPRSRWCICGMESRSRTRPCRARRTAGAFARGETFRRRMPADSHA